MKRLLRIAKKSARAMFQVLQQKPSYYSVALQSPIFITKALLNHLAYNQVKSRTPEEILERLLVMPFIEKIITKGILLEERLTYSYPSYLLAIEQGNDAFCAVILKKNKHFIVLSCFVRNEKKRNLSQPPLVHHT